MILSLHLIIFELRDLKIKINSRKGIEKKLYKLHYLQIFEIIESTYLYKKEVIILFDS